MVKKLVKTKKKAIHILKEGLPMTIEVLTFVVFLVICANFILAIIIFLPYIDVPIHRNASLFLTGTFFFIFYVLFLLGSIYYTKTLKEIYKKNEVKYLIWTLAIGLIIGIYLSYKYIGLSETLEWAISTIVALFVAYIFFKIGSKSTTP